MKAAVKHTLLVVDDEPDVCDSVHDLLRREFKVLKAKSAAEGLKLMETEEVHIIMTDQRMPQVSGVEMPQIWPPVQSAEVAWQLPATHCWL